jgi:hypothetical protein
MKIDMDEAYVYRSTTITPLTEVDCTRDFEMLRQTGVWFSVERLRVPQTCTQLKSLCLLFVNSGEWVQLNNVKGHFGMNMVKEVCQQILYSQMGEKIRDNKKYWVFGLSPSSGFFLNNNEKHNVSETGSVSVLRSENPISLCVIHHRQNPIVSTIRSVLTRHAGSRKMWDCKVQDVKDRILVSPRKSLRRFSQETGIRYSTRQIAVKKAKLHPYHVSVVQELLPTDLEKRVRYCLWFQRLVG